ncbi:MAG: cytochrome c oxidase subunit II [Actinomycetota bacterium]
MTRLPLLLRLAAAGTALSSCAPRAVGPQSAEVERLYDFFSVAAVAIFTVTAGLILWSLIRYRDKRGDDGPASQFDANVPLEILWFAIPTVIVAVLFAVSVRGLNEINEDPPRDSLHVKVQAFRWGWSFTYPGGVEVASLPDAPAEVVVPTGRPVTFELSSSDVVHSFSVPRLLLKRDVNPGSVNSLTVAIDEEGTFDAFCAEFCGLLHDEMDFSIRAVDEARFEAWLAMQEGENDGDG